jgi:hypothetical protein
MAIRAKQFGCLLLLLAVSLSYRLAHGEDPAAIEAPQPGLRTTTIAEYHSQLMTLRELLEACRASPAACDAEKAGSDDQVNEGGFNVHWGWLRELLTKAKDPSLKDRETLIASAANRLDEQAREAGLPMAPAVSLAQPRDPIIPFQQARAQADKVLAGAEFRKVTKNTWWDEQMGKLDEWLGRIFGGVASLGEHHRWLAPLIEWGFVALAITALLVWARRVTQRQRLAIRLETSTAAAQWRETARNWASLAQNAAERGDWRDAIHSLYWASVTELEGRRVWRQNNARTPREYLRLLQTDAPQYRPLRQLTQTEERIWYGLAPAAQIDYDRALALCEELRAA